MELTDRKKKILSTIISEYIDEAEPVGSASIAKNSLLALSSATIRNEMAELESMGYLIKPHTSAGRIPSDKAYRLYVNELMNAYDMSFKEIGVLKDALSTQIGKMNKLMKGVSQVLSELTSYTAFITSPEFKKGAIKTVELVPIDDKSMLIILVTNEGIMRNKRVPVSIGANNEFIHSFSEILKEKLSGFTLEEINVSTIQEIKSAMGSNFEMLFFVLDFITDIIDDVKHETEIYFSGAANIFNEYSDVSEAKELLEFLDDENNIISAISSDEEGNEKSKSDKVNIKIGSENNADIMKKSSVISANYYVGDKMAGKLGIIGPTRMDYSKAVGKIQRVCEYLNKMLNELYLDDDGG